MKKPIIGIAGFGLEGRAVYEYLRGKAEIHVFDDADIDVSGLEVYVHKGCAIPASIEVVYKSPGIPTAKLSLSSSDTRISTFMDIVLEKVGRRAVGVTGTKGKSTVTALIHHVLRQFGADAVLFGNIGIADAKTLQEDTNDKFYVLELSSYQCEHVTHSPHIAVFTNFYPEHLTHHGSLAAYRRAKLNIARFQTTRDIFINGTDIATAFSGTLVIPDFSRTFKTKLIGAHNQKNCALAFSALVALGVPEDFILRHFETFEPLPYRLEKVGTYNGITFYDDSLATIPQATLASLQALGTVDTLILGGQDRGISFDEIAQALPTTGVSTFIAFRDTGAKMTANVDASRVIFVSSMDEAVEAAYARTREGGTVLLSNASPSFNLFKDYKDKSAQYRDAIRRLAGPR
jgi:UDP-N-acetylmuramoylalanine--D-glutamate ligase